MCNNPWPICNNSFIMFRIVRLEIFSSCSRRKVAVATSLFDNLGFHSNPLFSFKLYSQASFPPLEDGSIHSSTVSFLVNSCGMQSETALNLASKVNFKTPRNPNVLLSLLQTQGFTKTQISNIVKKCPNLLMTKSDRILLPKFEFLHSVGLSNSECVQIIHSCPFLMGRSLNNRIIPCYKYLKSVLVDDEKVIKCLKRSPRAFLHNLPDKLAPNIVMLRTFGVSEVWISFLVTNYLDATLLEHSKFRSILNQVRDMGFDPFKRKFAVAISVLSKMTPFTLERKFEAYKKYGWSEDQTLLAFKKFPLCLMLSEENIFKTMDFFVHKMGLKPEVIATNPTVISYSLERRIIPRWSVVQSLYAKGLLKKELDIYSILYPGEKIFLERYVTKFPKDVTWLLHLYTGKVLP